MAIHVGGRNAHVADSLEYFRNAVYASYGSYTSYKYIEDSGSWILYTELAPEIVLTYVIEKDGDEEAVFLAEKTYVEQWGGRKRVDVVSISAPHAHSEYEDAIQTILKDLDGYHPDSTGQEHYEQLSSAIQTILSDLDGYALQSVVDVLNQTVTEHYLQHSEAIQTIIKDLDGYGASAEDLSITVEEHYDQHSDALQTILKELDGYIPSSEKGIADGVATLDSGGKIPAAQIPAVALPEVHVVLDDSERLALDVKEGDEAIQTSDGYHWIYDGYDWYVRPVNSHNADHYHGGADEICAQNLGSCDAEAGQILVADGEGGWTVEDNSAGSSMAAITYQFVFVANGTVNNKWLSLYEKTNYSNETPAVLPWKSKLIGISYNNENSGADPKIYIYKANAGSGNSDSVLYTWTLSNARVAYKTDLPEMILNAGDKVGVYHEKNGSTSSKNVAIILYFQATSDATTGSGTENFSGDF